MPCEVEGCEYQTRPGLTSYDQQFQQIRLHLAMKHPEVHAALDNSTVSNVGTNSARAEKLPRPAVTEDIPESDWKFFVDSWSRYKRSTGLEGQSIIDQLWACASHSLAKACYESGATATSTEEELLEIMKKLSIKAQNKLVNVVQFLSMSQDTDEPVAKFVSRLKGQSNVCDFTVTCSKAGCNTAVSYADNMVSHQLVRGLEDVSIQEKVLSLAATETELTLRKITDYVVAQETGTRSSKILGGGAGVAKITDYRRERSNTLPSNIKPNKEKQNETKTQEEKCHYCSKTGHGFKPDIETRKEKCEAWGLQCNNCGKVGHIQSACKSKEFKPAEAKYVHYDSEDGEEYAKVFSVSSSPFVPRKTRRSRGLRHRKLSKAGQWTPSEPEPHPVVIVTTSISGESYEDHGIQKPMRNFPTNVQAIADTGAQVLVGGMNLAHQLGVRRHELIPVSHRVGALNRSPLKVIGGMFLEISYEHETGEVREHKQLCYIAEGVDSLLLSTETLKKLGIISEDFPRSQGTPHLPQQSVGDKQARAVKKISWSDRELWRPNPRLSY